MTIFPESFGGMTPLPPSGYAYDTSVLGVSTM